MILLYMDSCAQLNQYNRILTLFADDDPLVPNRRAVMMVKPRFFALLLNACIRREPKNAPVKEIYEQARVFDEIQLLLTTPAPTATEATSTSNSSAIGSPSSARSSNDSLGMVAHKWRTRMGVNQLTLTTPYTRQNGLSPTQIMQIQQQIQQQQQREMAKRFIKRARATAAASSPASTDESSSPFASLEYSYDYNFPIPYLSWHSYGTRFLLSEHN